MQALVKIQTKKYSIGSFVTVLLLELELDIARDGFSPSWQLSSSDADSVVRASQHPGVNDSWRKEANN